MTRDDESGSGSVSREFEISWDTGSSTWQSISGTTRDESGGNDRNGRGAMIEGDKGATAGDIGVGGSVGNEGGTRNTAGHAWRVRALGRDEGYWVQAQAMSTIFR